MIDLHISAEKRELQGKGASRRLRHAGKVPGILYGGGAEPVSLQIPQNMLIRQLEEESFYSRILDLDLDGKKEKVVLKDLQRHPYKPVILHVDLLRVKADEALTMRVPLHFINEDTCVGVKQQGGLVAHQMAEIEIVCLPQDLPEYLEIDIAELELGSTIHVGDLSVPSGVQIQSLLHGGDPAQPVVSVQLPRVVEEVEETPEGEVAADAAAEGETPADAAPEGEDGSSEGGDS